MDAVRSPVGTLRAVPCGGAEEVARSYLKIHVRDGWSRACRGCRDHYPCLERRSAEALLGPQRDLTRLVLQAVPVVVGMLLVAGVAVGFAD